MPIYEYKSASPNCCTLCEKKFEIRQAIDDQPLTNCPKCKAPIERQFSRSFISTTESLPPNETFTPHTAQEAENQGLAEGFGDDQIWK